MKLKEMELKNIF